MRKVYICTFGCQMNDRDTEAVEGLLLARGYEKTADIDQADLLLYNTCSVRDHAEQKIFGRMGQFGKLKDKNPNLVVGIMGCMAQEHAGNFFKKNPEIDLVCGPGNLHQIPDLVDEIKEERQARPAKGRGGDSSASGLRLAVDRLDEEYSLEDARYRSGRLKALVTIMKGCDHKCTYCIVPFVRGAERSREAESILSEIKDLESRGFKDVMLLGQNVNSYGKGLAEPIDFAGLLEKIQAHAPGISRLRFITSHPKDAHTRLFTAMRDLPMVCGHLHLPVQSGSSRILRRMKREHTREWYIEQIQEYRSFVPEGTLTTDFIVGFPGEDEKDFLETASLIEHLRFDSAFIFTYSPRPGTPALKLDDDVPAEEKSKRLKYLLALQRSISLEKNQALIGKVQEVLFEAPTERDTSRFVGRTRGYKRVVASFAQDLTGRSLSVTITGAIDETLLGEITL